MMWLTGYMVKMSGPTWEIVIDNPLVELLLIPAFIFLIICMGRSIIILAKRKKNNIY